MTEESRFKAKHSCVANVGLAVWLTSYAST